MRFTFCVKRLKTCGPMINRHHKICGYFIETVECYIQIFINIEHREHFDIFSTKIRHTCIKFLLLGMVRYSTSCDVIHVAWAIMVIIQMIYVHRFTACTNLYFYSFIVVEWFYLWFSTSIYVLYISKKKKVSIIWIGNDKFIEYWRFINYDKKTKFVKSFTICAYIFN